MLRQRHILQDEKAGEAGKGAGGGDDGLGTIDERAARMGWTPKEKFRGDPAKWKDAATFVKDGEESLPILRERLHTMERSLAEHGRTATEARKFYEGVEKRAYEKAKKELEGKIASAAKAGDDATATAAVQELVALEGDHVKAEVRGQEDPEWNSWIAQNPWYKDDPDLSVEAEAVAYKLRAKAKRAGTAQVEGIAFLNLVKEELVKQFPQKFGNPRRQQSSGVEGAGGAGAGGGGGNGAKKGWDNLPAEAKQAGERYIKNGYVKDKATYAADYWSQVE